MDILLIPGFMLDADLWSDMRSGLTQLGRVIDADTTQDCTIAGMADRAIESLNRPAIIVGFSMGGYVAREIAYRAPDRVVGLALIATSSSASAPHTPLLPKASFSQLGRAAIIRSLHPDNRSEATIRRVQAMSRRLGAAVYQRQMALERLDDTARLGEITCPTITVAAAQDQLRSVEESRTLHDHIPNSGFRIVERSGHLIPIEQPYRLLNAVSDLAI